MKARPGEDQRRPRDRSAARSRTGDERDDDVRGVAVEVLSSAVVDRCRSRVCVSRCELHVSKRYAGVECGHDERGSEHVRMNGADTRASADRADPPMGSPTIEPAAVTTDKNRTGRSFVPRWRGRSCVQFVGRAG